MARTIPFSGVNGMPSPFFDSWEDLQGVPGTMLENELMYPRPKQPLPYIWEGAPPVQPQPLPDMIPGYVPPTPQQKAQAEMMGPLQGIQVPPSLVQDRTPKEPVVAEKPKLTGWKNIANNLYAGIGDALAGASTPNIAGGGGFDVVRSLGVGQQARKQREAYEKQQQVAAEQRKTEAEDRQRKIEYETERAKREKAVAEQQMEADRARTKREERQAANEDRAHRFDHIKIADGVAYNMETGQTTQLKDVGGAAGREQYLRERYARTGNQADNPDNPANLNWILRDYHPDPDKPKTDTTGTLIEGLMSPIPEVRAQAKAIDEANKAHELRVASARKNAEDAGLSIGDIARMTNDYGEINARLGRTKLEIAQEAARRRAHINSDKTKPEDRAPQITELDQWERGKYAAAEAAAKKENRETADLYSKAEKMRKAGGAVPAAGAPAAAAPAAAVGAPTPAAPNGTAVAPNGKRYPIIYDNNGMAYYNTGLDANGNVMAQPIPSYVKPPKKKKKE